MIRCVQYPCVAEGWKRVHKLTSRLRDDVSLRAVALPSTSIAARTRDRSALASHVMAGRLADDQTHYPSEVPNRAAGIFRMAGHMLGERLLHRRGLVVSLVNDDPQPFPRRRDERGLDLCQHAFNSRGAGLHAWWSSRAQRLSCREQP